MRSPWMDTVGFVLVVLVITLYYYYGLLDYYLPENWARYPEMTIGNSIDGYNS